MKEIAKGRLLTLYYDDNGKDRVRLVDGIMIIPFSKSHNKYILVKNVRNPRMKDGSLEFPGGKLELNEDIIDGARRELLEETGYIGDMQFIQYIYSAPAVLDSRLSLFFAPNVTFSRQAEDNSALVFLTREELLKYPFEDAAAMACMSVIVKHNL